MRKDVLATGQAHKYGRQARWREGNGGLQGRRAALPGCAQQVSAGQQGTRLRTKIARRACTRNCQVGTGWMLPAYHTPTPPYRSCQRCYRRRRELTRPTLPGARCEHAVLGLRPHTVLRFSVVQRCCGAALGSCSGMLAGTPNRAAPQARPPGCPFMHRGPHVSQQQQEQPDISKKKSWPLP